MEVNGKAEVERIRERYARRTQLDAARLYSAVAPYDLYIRHERESHLARMLRERVQQRLDQISCLEVGCGSGSNLLQLLSLGFDPVHLTGNELLKTRADIARRRLPELVRVLVGDARTLDIAPASYDIVYQSTVFSSILDDGFQTELASRMWALLKPGGAILWYDLAYNNPCNPDVRGVSRRRIRALFPDGAICAWRVTLSPPLGRRLALLAPGLLPLAGAIPLFRSHLWAWIEKRTR